MSGWTNIAFYIILFNVFFNAGAVAITEAGISDTHEINPQPGGDFSDAESAAQDARGGGGGTSTLIGLWTFLGGFVSAIVNAIPAAAMMKNVGVPDFFVDFVYTAQAFVVGFAVIAFFRTGGGI